VQGTTYGISSNLLAEIGFFNDRIKLWGCGDDPDIFWKLFLAYKEGKVKGIYDGNIISIDRISKRWITCLEKMGGIDFFREDFM
jgi:hypothetical protein